MLSKTSITSESSFNFLVCIYISFYLVKKPRINPEPIITGRKPIMTNAIWYPTANATTIPLIPMLILFKTEVILVTRPCWTFDIWTYILEQSSAGLVRSCHAIYCLNRAARYSFLAMFICLSLVITQAAVISQQFTKSMPLLMRNP